MKDALFSVSSNQWRSGVLRAPKNDPVSRLSRAYAQASYSTTSLDNGDTVRRLSGKCPTCGLQCWRESIQKHLLLTRATYLGIFNDILCLYLRPFLFS